VRCETDPMTTPVAVVTGAGSPTGIGFASARRFAGQGFQVIVAATSERIHDRAKEIGGIGFVGDLTDPTVADALVETAISMYGRIDVLVNNAGMTSVTVPDEAAAVDELSDEQWRLSMSRNIDSMFYVTRAAVRPMRRAGYGRIVNISSVSGPVAAFPADAAYHAAKAAVLGLTRSVALDTAADGITVNAVAPGWIATETSPEHELRAGAATPVGRPGTADEVASLIAYLASRDAGYVTGQLIVVDGGNSIVEAHA
jgi:3-oxoacyl-[acyl-carrier protein] reductase